MSNNVNLAKFVNIGESGKEYIPNDVYKLMDNFKTLIETNPEFAKFSHSLNDLNINR